MKISVEQTFLDSYDRYEAGQEYEVSEEVGTTAVTNGWATSGDAAAPSAPAPEVVDLEVHDVMMGQSSEVQNHG